MRTVLLFAILMVCWLLLSGHYTPLITALGVASCVFAAVMARRIGGDDGEGLPLHLFFRLPAYQLWLWREIIVSNLTTGRIILQGTEQPEWFEVPTSQASSAGLVTYANSITLTPGTVTVDVLDADGGGKPRLLVQALHPDFADDLRAGEMDRRVTALEARPAMEFAG